MIKEKILNIYLKMYIYLMGNFIDVQKYFHDRQLQMEKKQKQINMDMNKIPIMDMNKIIIDKINMDIDLHIRKQLDFDSVNPLHYKYVINTKDSLIFLKKINAINKYKNISFIDFVKQQKRFKITSNNEIILKCKTPFQEENKRVFGYFNCSKCNKKWTSAYSWANAWQKCNKCNSQIYPYEQTNLIKSPSSKGIKLHCVTSCGKCIELYRSCVTLNSETNNL